MDISFLQWLASGGESSFELAYVDPLLSSLGTGKWDFLNGISSSSSQRAVIALLKQMSQIAGGSHENEFGARLRTDRALQRKFAQVVEGYQYRWPDRYYSHASRLAQDRRLLADRLGTDSLVIVDSMLGVTIRAPQAIVRRFRSIDTKRYRSGRSVELMLVDCPAPLVRPDDPVVGLVVDPQTLYHWTHDFADILRLGWYPTARIVGLYGTSLTGDGLLDVIAILVLPMAPLSQLLGPKPGENLESSRGWLETVQKRTLNRRSLDSGKHIMTA